MSNDLLDRLPENNGDPTPTPPPLSEFDPARLRLNQDFAATLGVKKLRTTLPVRKPDRTWFVRVHPDPDYRHEVGILELKEDREIYLVDPALWPELSTESTVSRQLLVTAMNRQNVLFLWLAKLPRPDGRIDEWCRSALEAIAEAEHHWVRVQANMSLGAYELSIASAEIPAPDWVKLVPDAPAELLKIAFHDKLIHNLDHPVLKRLRGEA